MAEFYLARVARAELELRKKAYRIDDAVRVESQPFPKEYDFERVEVASLGEVETLLRRLTDDPHAALVMGRPLYQRSERTRATFDNIQRDMWVIDLDSVPEVGTIQESIEFYLPFLRGCQYVVQLSASMGFKDGLRARVVCRVKEEFDLAMFYRYAIEYNNDLKAYCGERGRINYIDPYIYDPEHLIYTSRPNCIDVPDPYPERVLFFDGESCVTLKPLPKMKRIVRAARKVRFDILPKMPGTWGAGPDHGRTGNAVIGGSMLRAYMGERWSNVDERKANWEQMMLSQLPV